MSWTQAASLRARPRAARWFSLGAGGLFFLAAALRYLPYLLDDAYISLRYARNLVEGHGLVFNVAERVEGYTNFGWTLLGAAFLRLGLDGMVAWKVVSVLATLALLAAVHRLDRHLAPGSPAPAVAWLLLLEGFAYWASTGMESMAFASLLALAIVRDLVEEQRGGRPLAAIAFLALALLRPEGILCFGLWHGLGWLLDRLQLGGWPLRRPLRDSLIVGLPWAAWFAGRWSYYGDPLPNTFYAKVTGGPEQWLNGWISLRQWIVWAPLLALALLVPLFLLVRRRQTPKTRVVLRLSLFALAWIFYVVKVGGDFMPFFRFFLPILPLGALLASWAIGRLTASLSAGPTFAVAIGALALHCLAGAATEQTYRAFVAHRTTTVGLEVGRWIDQRLPENATIAVNTAGAVPWSSRRPTIDTLGLTDRAIAHHPVYVISPLWAGHRRGWGAYTLGRRPELVLWYNSAGLYEPHYLGDHQLADNPYFRFLYQAERTQLPTSEPALLARFLGDPFEVAPRREARSPDLGLRFERRTEPFEHSLAHEAPITVFALRRRQDPVELWPPDPSDLQGLGPFLDRYLDHWHQQARTAAPPDPLARDQALRLCNQAYASLQAGDLPAARRLLTEATPLAERGRLALAYQYISNLAVLDHSLLLAVQAQREALRLEPTNELYRRNLETLLTVPWKTFTEEATD